MRRRGVTLVELLASVVLLAIASAGAIATWNLSARAPANKRVTDMGAFVATRQLELLKAQKYLSLADTAENAPLVTYYDKFGNAAGGATTGGYKVKSWTRALVNRDGTTNTEDLREIEIKVWNSTETQGPYEQIRTLISFGGL